MSKHANILRKIAEVTLGECQGTRTIVDSNDVFPGYIDGSFKKIKANRATPVTKTEVHEMVKEYAVLTKMFSSLGRDLDTLIFTQDQVVEFCVKHRNELRTDGYGTFFLLKEGENFFVAHVYVYDDGRLNVRLRAFFEIGYVWFGESRHRVVVPQL